MKLNLLLNAALCATVILQQIIDLSKFQSDVSECQEIAIIIHEEYKKRRTNELIANLIIGAVAPTGQSYKIALQTLGRQIFPREIFAKIGAKFFKYAISPPRDRG